MGAEVLGANLARLEDIDSLQAAFVRHLLLIFPEQSLDVLQQVAFSRCFGELQVHVLDQYRHPQHPEIYVLSNVAADGKTTGSHPDRGTPGIRTCRFRSGPRLRRSSMASRYRVPAATRCMPTCMPPTRRSTWRRKSC
jgi:hypothetical protein